MAATWLVTAYDLKLAALSRFSTSVPRTEQAGYRQLVVALAMQIYRRERGALPPSDEALIGTYLKSLPDDTPPDVYDGTAPIVE